MYIGTVLPWHEFHNPYVTTTATTTTFGAPPIATAFDTSSVPAALLTTTTAVTTTTTTTTGSGITYPRLLAMATLVLFMRRVPALLLTYRAMPRAVRTWREALFMGYFGPIGVGAVYYLQSTRHVYFDPERLGSGGEEEEGEGDGRKLLEALSPSTFLSRSHGVVPLSPLRLKPSLASARRAFLLLLSMLWRSGCAEDDSDRHSQKLSVSVALHLAPSFSYTNTALSIKHPPLTNILPSTLS